ncbi:MAG: hypothetical protein ACFFDI_30360, partial [Promethearchaeota archaeon]
SLKNGGMMAPFRGLPHTTSFTGGADWRNPNLFGQFTRKGFHDLFGGREECRRVNSEPGFQ